MLETAFFCVFVIELLSELYVFHREEVVSGLLIQSYSCNKLESDW